jgi:hypothetical protein
MMTMKFATHAMARMTPGGTCARAARAAGSAGVAGATVVLEWDMTATPSGRSSVLDLLNKFKLNKFKLITLG